MPPRLTVIFLILIACGSPQAGPKPATPVEPLAECLVRKGAHLYGASWCKPCHEQLALFGDQSALVPYTDCVSEGSLDFIQECADAGVPFGTVIPVWVFKDGSRLYGVRHPIVLAAVAHCPYP